MAEEIITAPLPGVFYRRSEPSADPFVEVGDQVTEGTVIGLIEVMKQFQDVAVTQAGVVRSFAVEDGATVGLGDPLATIEVAG